MSKKLIYLIPFILVMGLVLTSGANAAAPVAPKPEVLWWQFNEGSGTTVDDASGNGREGDIFGATWKNGGYDSTGYCLEFGGDGDHVLDDDGENYLNGLGALTVCMWIKSNLTTTDKGFLHGVDPAGQDRVFAMRYDQAGASFGGSNILKIGVVSSGGNQNLESSSNLQVTEWQHVAMTWSSGDLIRFYVNGVEDTPSGRNNPNNTGTVTECTKLIIGMGGKFNDASGGGWDGLIDDVRIYNRVLTDAEIAAVAHVDRPYARDPQPEDGVIYENTWISLNWTPGDFAVSHDVYLGDNFDDVNDGTTDTFQGNQSATNLIVGFLGFPYPDGLVSGTTYYWRIDEVNDLDPNSPWKGNVWSFTVPPKKAYDPNPSDGVKFVDPDVECSWTAGFSAKLHTVYFGDNFDDVNSAVVGLPQSGTTYTPGTLELEKDYYWRIDEFDGVATHKGDVWSFKTLPVIPITDPNLIGWWKLDEGYGTLALDWSGHGNHGTLFGPEWTIPGLIGNAALSFDGTDYVAIQNLSYNSTDNTELTVCAWIRTSSSGDQYIASFDRNEYWRLEINGNGGGPGQVGWDVMTSSGQVDYGSSTRVDDGLWHHVTGVFDNGRLTIYIDARPEASASGGNTFGSGDTRYGFIGANSEAANFNGSRGSGSPISGDIDELCIYHKALTQEEILQVMRGDPLLAWGPNPTNGSTPYIREATPLSWSPGDNASQHDVYFGTDRDAVDNADASDTTGIYRGRQGVTIYTPSEGVEWGGGPYYWRIDEYNTDATISKGNLWSFTVADFIGIEDFEDYNDWEPDRIFETWIDGWGTTTNGSTAGYPDPNFDEGEHFVEVDVVHGGSQSMPYFYDNNFKYSEATLTLVSARDWTEEGVGVLSLWFYGDASNAAEPMYVALNGSAVVYHDNLDAALIDEWTEWRIDLQEFAAQGVNLTNVNTISIGFGDKNNLQPGGSGLVFFDDIRLYRPAPPEPVEPEPAP